MRRVAYRLGACAIVALLVAGPAAAQRTEQRQPFTHPHQLRYTLAEDIVGLNLHVVNQTAVRYLSTLTMAYLLRTNAHDEYVPELATAVPTRANGGISPDGKTIVYRLRRDAKWSDGRPFTSNDVVFSTKVVLNPANNEPTRNGWDRIARVEARDRYTVAFHLTRPYANFASTFFSSSGVPLLPEHLLRGLPDINHATYNALPVGIGPFRYSAWRRADAVEMVANSTYFRGRPKLDRIVFRIIPDRNTALAQLQTHEVDLWFPVPGNYLERVSSIAGISTLRLEAFAFNQLAFNVEHPTVRDPDVRRALRLAIDRGVIRDKIGHGLNLLSETPFGPSHPAHVTRPVSLEPYDPERANALLERAGWRREADGIRAKNGVRLMISVGMPSGTPDSDQTVELIRAWWKAVGVGMEVQHFADALFFAPYQDGGIITTGKTDVTFFGWTSDGFGDLASLFGCAFIEPHGQNSSRYCNPAVDAASAAQLVEYDAAKRRVYTDRIQEILARDVPVIIMSVRRNVYAFNRDLRGFHPSAGSAFDDMMNVDI
jgi:peptide/nickel transport system substrate-binding protein